MDRSSTKKVLLDWRCNLKVRIQEKVDGSNWHSVVFTMKSEGQLSLRGSLSLGKVRDPFWCMPGLFWGDNRQDQTAVVYPKFDSNLETPRVFVSSFWQFHVSRLNQPIVACHDGQRWRILEAAPYGRVSRASEPVAIGIGFSHRQNQAWLECSLPPVEEPYRPTGSDYTEPKVNLLSVKKGDQIEWRYRIHELTGERAAILDLLAATYHGGSTRDQKSPSIPPTGEIVRATRNGLMHWHYQPEQYGFKYAVAYDRIAQQIAECSGCTLDQTQMMLGWVSGWILFEPLLDYAERFQESSSKEAVVRIWNHLAKTVNSPSGFWWSRYVPKLVGQTGVQLKNMFDGGQFNDWDGGWLANKRHIHLRTTGDAVLRATRVLEKHRDSLPFSEGLLADVLRQARMMNDFARKSPLLPLCLDAVSGEVQPLSGTASMIWISTWVRLARMNQWKDEDVILKCADAYRSSVESGLLYGAPEDVGECMTSEDIYIAINVYCDLYEHFKKPEDLQTALQAARWLYLWRCSYKIHLPPRSLLGIYQLNSRGGDMASSKNSHLHVYGLDADESLYKLTRWTRDPRWKELADDHWRFASSLVCMEDGQFNGFEGMLSEQYYFIDWSPLGNAVSRFEKDDRKAAWDVGLHFRNHGNVAGFSTAWCVGFVLQAGLNRLKRENSRLSASRKTGR